MNCPYRVAVDEDDTVQVIGHDGALVQFNVGVSGGELHPELRRLFPR